MNKKFWVISLVVACLAMAAPISAVADSSGGPVKGEMTFNITVDTKPDNKDTRLWVPYPVSDQYQTIEDVKIEGNFNNHGIYRDKNNGTMILYADWTAPINEQKRLILSFNVIAEERNRKNAVEKGNAIPAEVVEYLGATPTVPVGGKMGEIANTATKGKKGVEAKARAAYDWVVDNTVRDPNVAGCGVGDVLQTVAKGGGKCVDINSVFVSVARSAGVPAREVFGIRLGKDEGVNDVTKGHHCWAEYYLPGTGWVPVDAGDVRKKILEEKLENDKAAIEKYREFYFNGLDKYRISLSEGGRSLYLSPKQNDGPLNYFMYPYAEVDGKALEWLAAQKELKYKVTFKKS